MTQCPVMPLSLALIGAPIAPIGPWVTADDLRADGQQPLSQQDVNLSEKPSKASHASSQLGAAIRESLVRIALPSVLSSYSQKPVSSDGTTSTARLKEGAPDSDEGWEDEYVDLGSSSHLSMRHRAKLPLPNDIQGTFFATRREAMLERQYDAVAQTSQKNPLIPVAFDRPGGSTAKMFQCIGREELSDFIESIPQMEARNMYCLVDESSPLDPFFDVDGKIESLPSTYLEYMRQSCSSTLSAHPTLHEGKPWRHCVFDDILLRVTRFLVFHVQRFFTQRRRRQCFEITELNDGDNTGEEATKVSGTGAGAAAVVVDRVLALTACDCGQQLYRPPLSDHLKACAPRDDGSYDSGKVSYHLHLRTRNEEGASETFCDVTEHRAFAAQLTDVLTRCEEIDDPEHEYNYSHSWERDLLRRVLDLSVYTRWRAFRLPYNCKSISLEHAIQSGAATLQEHAVSSHSEVPIDVQAFGLRMTTLMAVKDNLHKLLPKVSGGSWAAGTCVRCSIRPLPPVDESHGTSDDPRVVEQSVVMALTEHVLSVLRVLLPIDASGATCLNIEGDPSSVSLLSCKDRSVGMNSVFEMSTILRPDVPCRDRTDEAEDDDEARGPNKRIRDGVRRSVSDLKRKLLCQVFRCIDAAFSTLQPHDLSATFEEGGSIRGYRVSQKACKFCPRLQRAHSKTFVHLYITYGSIKVKCYSNDCHSKCIAIPWAAPAHSQEETYTNEYPRFDELALLRAELFPELPLDVLQRLYPKEFLSGEVRSSS